MWVFAVLSAAMVSSQQNYNSCVGLVDDAPEAARAYAERWMRDGGGNEAKHCAAVAALALDAPGSAGALLADLAEAEVTDPGVAARLFIQSAEAFMQAGKKTESYAALRGAYKAVPDAAEVHMAAAPIYAAGAQWEGVVLTINALERHADLSADALALRARAHFRRGAYDLSAYDTSRALTHDPYLIDALVLRGDLLEQGVAIPDDPIVQGSN